MAWQASDAEHEEADVEPKMTLLEIVDPNPTPSASRSVTKWFRDTPDKRGQQVPQGVSDREAWSYTTVPLHSTYFTLHTMTPRNLAQKQTNMISTGARLLVAYRCASRTQMRRRCAHQLAYPRPE